jgi:hypothetical protein
MAMTCKEVWQEISSYLDNTISPQLRRMLELHLAYCRHCTAIVDGVHNVISLVADGRVFALPAGFSARLRERLGREM